MNKLLEKFWKDILIVQPDIEHSTTMNVENEFGGYYFLTINSKNRDCIIRFVNQSEILQCQFLWDNCYLFEITGKGAKTTSLLIKRWLCDFTAPSELEREFSWLSTGKLARYYEEGRGLEGEFILSWDNIERFYGRLESFEQKTEALNFITQLRMKGFDKTLRAGQSMYTFMVSRARHHGWLKSYISFDFRENGVDMEIDINGARRLFLPTVELSEQVNDLLKELEATPIEDVQKELHLRNGKDI